MFMFALKSQVKVLKNEGEFLLLSAPSFFFFALFKPRSFRVSAQLCVYLQSVKGWEGFSTGTTAAVCRKTGKTGHVRNSSTPWRGTESLGNCWLVLVSAQPPVIVAQPYWVYLLWDSVSKSSILSPPSLSWVLTLKCDPTMLKCQLKTWIFHLLLLH